MDSARRHALYCVLALFDALIIVLSYLAASWLYIGTMKTLGGLSQLRAPFYPDLGFGILVLYSLILVAAYGFFRVYGCIYLGKIRGMARRIAQVNTVGLVLFSALLYVTHLENVSRMTLLLFYLISTFLVILKGWLTVRYFYRLRKNKKALRFVLVAGCGEIAKHYANVIGVDSSRFESVVGYVASSSCSEDEEEVLSKCPLLKRRLGTVDDLDELLSSTKIDEIVIALEVNEYDDIRKISSFADKYGAALTLVPFYNEIVPQSPKIDCVDDVKLVNLRSMPLSSIFNSTMKRAADIVVSVFVLILVSWLMVITAIGVRLSSPGPILFKQERIGLNNRPFNMLKFRSMRVNIESNSAWSTDEDPRKTRFGSFIRKCSIDELPQFLSVLKGDMSIVGPRPEIPHYVEKFRETIPRYMLRHQVRPGITGWAQVNGFRGDTSIEGRIEHDLWYIENWSFWLDVKIFFKTLFGGFLNSEKIS
ncbi:undecaprenyl-phosphate glucose phosphotransferase [Berryella intestinalis]|uniref:undecaprenyl-phosphate glucose phosphotransferase n=1 Tax=Berryella intestinalis TaxID=1531429 RepID=UPI0006894A6D|nr:undecaprenyl-phosphate glucose phosphotransferase [Berryella intestinalis]